ncbi:Thiosulfate sulfurtransferase [Thiorhodovibrio winogradskyi]|uniref:Thiosulfate sulfurtransferase n=1 Tax=Thiorhodovibrio winogradskyi TaxID=77007 RepID=A0ABZ0S6G7_9GAMM|nr:sulfurtransferase [Thiorhodovibrio winogradskyi]
MRLLSAAMSRAPRALKLTVFVLALALWCLPLLAADLRVSPAWLQARLDQPDVVIVDARAPADFAKGHIVGAVNFPELATYRDQGRDGRLVEPAAMQERLRDLGLTRDTLTVVYDDGALLAAARVFWALEVYGLRNPRLLDRGYLGWEAAGFPTTTTLPRPQPSNYVAEIDPRRIATRFTTRLAMADPRQQIIDARSPDAYRGRVSKARRFGHIPSAINVPVHRHLDEAADGSELRDLAALAAIYADVPKDRRLVLYCDLGRVSAINYIALRELGYQVANYDASWLEWGNDPDLPILGPDGQVAP